MRCYFCFFFSLSIYLLLSFSYISFCILLFSFCLSICLSVCVYVRLPVCVCVPPISSYYLSSFFILGISFTHAEVSKDPPCLSSTIRLFQEPVSEKVYGGESDTFKYAALYSRKELKRNFFLA